MFIILCFEFVDFICSARSQGGSVGAIQPEYLMERRDYQTWRRLQMVNISDNRETQRESENELEELVFEALSKRCWMDLLMQLLKVLRLLHSP